MSVELALTPNPSPTGRGELMIEEALWVRCIWIGGI